MIYNCLRNFLKYRYSQINYIRSVSRNKLTIEKKNLCLENFKSYDVLKCDNNNNINNSHSNYSGNNNSNNNIKCIKKIRSKREKLNTCFTYRKFEIVYKEKNKTKKNDSSIKKLNIRMTENTLAEKNNKKGDSKNKTYIFRILSKKKKYDEYVKKKLIYVLKKRNKFNNSYNSFVKKKRIFYKYLRTQKEGKNKVRGFTVSMTMNNNICNSDRNKNYINSTINDNTNSNIIDSNKTSRGSNNIINPKLVIKTHMSDNTNTYTLENELNKFTPKDKSDETKNNKKIVLKEELFDKTDDGCNNSSKKNSIFLTSNEREEENNAYKFLKILYKLIEKKKDINENVANSLNKRMLYVIKTNEDMKLLFLLLHTMNKLVCINNLIKKLSDDIYKINDTELLSIILRVLINSLYKDKKLLFFILDKLKENIQLGICTPLTISNTFYSYSKLYQKNLIKLEEIPLQEISIIFLNYYSSFSYILLCEFVEMFQNFSSCIDKKMNTYDKSFHKNIIKLFNSLGNYFIKNDIIEKIKFQSIVQLVYGYAKNKIYHEQLFLYIYPSVLKSIKQYNKDIVKNKYYNTYVWNDCKKMGEDDNKDTNTDTELDTTKNKTDILKTTLHNNIFDKSKSENTNNLIFFESLDKMVKNVTHIVYAYSKFNIYIDELYNEIILFLQHTYKYIECTNLSQCLISLTKVNCNINILLSKIHHNIFHINSNTINFFKYCSSIDLMNFLLSFSKNLYMEKEIYNTLAELLIKEKKIYVLNAIDLVNIIHAYSKIYYVHNKLFSTVDSIISSRLDDNPNYLSAEMAIKYINSCTKLFYKNEQVIYKMIEIIHNSNFKNIKVFDLFKLLRSVKKLDVTFDSLEAHIKIIAPNFTFDTSKYTNYYYRAEKSIHMRKKKWVW
ncbi:conserved protein, unknown function [Hepatocystis sp. ex Piliocolobus tephrosceles]|nr:conserved protein, unknown function [Hepatocystis sp. ex Piliocolobus tephrosceles]